MAVGEGNASKEDKASKGLFAQLPKRGWLLLGAASATIATFLGLLDNIRRAADLTGDFASSTAEKAMAYALGDGANRARVGAHLLSLNFSPDRTCIVRVDAIDLDGNGVAADLAIQFMRKARKQDCRQHTSPVDAAFYRRDGLGEKFIGSPPLPSEWQIWTIVGPVIFEQIAERGRPQIIPYMYFGGKLRKLCCIATIEVAGNRDTTFLEDRKQSGVLVLNGAGIWRVRFDPQGKGEIENVSTQAITDQDDGSHLLQSGNGLKFDGSIRELQKWRPGKGASGKFVGAEPGPDGRLRPSEGDVYRIEMWPADRLYLVGCTPVRGLEPDESAEGAFAPEFASSPLLRCTLGKGAAFSVQVTQRRPH
ncbi:MAG: hypothetical protein JOZ72_13230 [Alphaproteobacteria bacterium]|nr:hypothetical protein [Alphaproteobacteria bacterium]